CMVDPTLGKNSDRTVLSSPQRGNWLRNHSLVINRVAPSVITTWTLTLPLKVMARLERKCAAADSGTCPETSCCIARRWHLQYSARQQSVIWNRIIDRPHCH